MGIRHKGILSSSHGGTIAPPPNLPPIVDAGPNQAITLPTNSVSLSGTATDPDGSVSSYLWVQLSGPATYTITTPTLASTTVTGLVAGVYQFQLSAVDNLGSVGADTVQINVNAAPPPVNLPPVSNAGPNQAITLPTNSVVMAGSGTDPDGTVVAYAWTLISGPSTYIVTAPSSPTTTITSLVQGTYVFQLKVTDNMGATNNDTMSIVVSPAPIPDTVTAHIALASNPSTPITTTSIVSPANLSLVDASIGTAPVTVWSWTKISGSGSTITTPTQSSTTITGMTPGTYVYRLTVFLSGGATSSSDLTVTVAAPAPPGFYVAQNGNDAANGLTPATAWQTHSRVTTALTAGTIVAGNTIYYQKGGTFTGNLNITRSGTSGNPITISSYGTTGGKPLFTAFTTVPGWTNLGSNIWESTNPVSTLSSINIVSINGVNTAMGRVPKTGFWIITGASATSITDSVSGHLNTTNYIGGIVVVRTARWHLDKATITSASGNTINFSGLSYDPATGWGYFIQGHVSTLTQQNDWYYNTSTKKLRIYSTSQPVNVQVSTTDTIVTQDSSNYILYDGINFTGANSYGINHINRTATTIQNCDFNFMGISATIAYPGNAPQTRITSCTVTESNSSGFDLGSSNNATVLDNVLYNIGNLFGMGESGDTSYCGIISHGDNCVIQYNDIQRVGYCGIHHDGNSTLVDKNFIDTTTYIKDDGGGIYCYPQVTGPSSSVTYLTRTVSNNIVLNAIGQMVGGAPSSNYPEAMCVYNDGTSPNTRYTGNTMWKGHFGFFSNAGHDNFIDNNTTLDNTYGIYYQNFNGYGIANLTVTNNTFVSTGLGGADEFGQYSAVYYPNASNMPPTFVASNNVYARPLDETHNYMVWNFPSLIYSKLPAWKSATGKDSGSTTSPIIVNNSSKIRFEYNKTKLPITITLGATIYKDMRGNNLSGNIILQPFTSIVLLNTT